MLHLRELGPPNPGRSFRRGGLRSGRDGRLVGPPGMLGAAEICFKVVECIFWALILAARMAASVVEFIFRCFFALAPKRYSRF